MLDWIKKIGKETPEFWKNYTSKFETKSNRFVVISCETSGKNPETDVILSVAGIGVSNNSVCISDSFEIKINYEENDLKIIKPSINATLNPIEALKSFLEFVENAKLVSYHVDFEVDIINKMLSNLNCGKLKNEVFDLEVMHKKSENNLGKQFTLRELFEIYAVEKSDRNTAAMDAFSMSILFLKLKSKLKL